MLCYNALVVTLAEGLFELRFPELPDCIVPSGTWEQITLAATTALEAWLTGPAPATPASLAEMMSRPDVADAVATGAVLLPIFATRARPTTLHEGQAGPHLARSTAASAPYPPHEG